MITIRRSASSTANQSLVLKEAKKKEGNCAWLKRVGASNGLLLLGGAAISHFRIRVAQSHARMDLKPSLWSLSGILTSSDSFLSVPLELCVPASEIAQRNGVQTCRMTDYDDPDQFPNIAAIRFTADTTKILDNATRIADQRSIIDLPALMLPWLSYIWIAGKAPNPLVEGLGLPSAAFVESAYGIAGIELTPGLSSATSCPEAIWQAAKWWHEFYAQAAPTTHEDNARPQNPTGSYAMRQPAAAADWPGEKKS
jgi:hypothetical protein